MHLPQEVQRPNLGTLKYTNNSSRGIFQRAKEARFNSFWSHAKLNGWSDFLLSANSLPALQICRALIGM